MSGPGLLVELLIEGELAYTTPPAATLHLLEAGTYNPKRGAIRMDCKVPEFETGWAGLESDEAFIHAGIKQQAFCDWTVKIF